MNESLIYCLEVLKNHLEGLNLKLNQPGKYSKLPNYSIDEIRVQIKKTEIGITKLNSQFLHNFFDVS